MPKVLLAAALKMAPDYIELRRDYACVLLDRHKHAEAIAQLDDLFENRPEEHRLPHPASHRDRRTRRSRRRASAASSTCSRTRSRKNRHWAADLHLSIAHSLKDARPPRRVD